MSRLYWPICALFGHEALGLMTPGRGDRDVMVCSCGKREMSGSLYAMLWWRMNRRA